MYFFPEVLDTSHENNQFICGRNNIIYGEYIKAYIKVKIDNNLDASFFDKNTFEELRKRIKMTRIYKLGSSSDTDIALHHSRPDTFF